MIRVGWRVLVGLLLGLTVGAVAVASDAAGTAQLSSQSTVSLARNAVSGPSLSQGFDFAAVGQLLAGLVLVLVLFLGLAWLVKRTGVAGGFSHQGLKVLATLPLSARERVVLVQAGSKQLLLGVAPGRVNLLESYDQPLVSEPKEQQAPFSDWLQRAMAKSQTVDRSVGGDVEGDLSSASAKKNGGIAGD